MAAEVGRGVQNHLSVEGRISCDALLALRYCYTRVLHTLATGISASALQRMLATHLTELRSLCRQVPIRATCFGVALWVSREPGAGKATEFAWGDAVPWLLRGYKSRLSQDTFDMQSRYKVCGIAVLRLPMLAQ